jgi:hypothetical protein
VQEVDSHVHSLMISLFGLFLLLPRAWYFKINELRYFYILSCSFNKLDPLALDLLDM